MEKQAAKISAAKKAALKPKRQNKLPLSQNFMQHLEKIRRAKEAANLALEGADAAHCAVAIAWEMVFDLFCGLEEISLEDLAQASAVMQRLAASDARLKPAPKNAGGGLNKAAIEEIEQKLKLL